MHLNAQGVPEPVKLTREIVAEPVEGWRIWKVVRREVATLDKETIVALADAFDRGENPFRSLIAPQLCSVGREYTWRPGVTEATCISNEMTYGAFMYGRPPQMHDAPDANCNCGIWILKDENDLWRTLAEYRMQIPLVYGRVRAWGRLVEHERGFRAQYAQPLSASLIAHVGDDKRTARELASAYQIPVTIADEPEAVANEIRRLVEEAQKFEEQQHALMHSSYAAQLQQYANPMIGLTAPQKPPKPKKWFMP